MSSILHFQPTNDRQLWRYEFDKQWTIPIYATPGLVEDKPHWLIIPALTLSVPGWQKLNGVLESLTIHQGQEFWVVKAEDFKAEKCEGVTPEYYLRYVEHGGGATPTGLSNRQLYGAPIGPQPGNDFIEEVWKRTSVCELNLLRLVFHAIRQELPRYLIASGAPVSFGWMELRALPYRANWKQILLAKFPKILVVLRGKSTEERNVELERTGFRVAQSSTSLMALATTTNTHTVGWTVECDLQKIWHDYIEEHERDVLAAIGNDAYFKRATNLFIKAKKQALSVFYRWLEQTARPCASIIHGRLDGRNKLVPALRPGRVVPEIERDIAISVTSDTSAEALHDLDGTPVVAEEAEDMPEVPIILLRSPNVWQNRGDVFT